jgi:hypothetical protein
VRQWPIKEGKRFSNSFLSKFPSNAILNQFKAVSKLGPKIEVVQKNVLYNFVKRS